MPSVPTAMPNDILKAAIFRHGTALIPAIGDWKLCPYGQLTTDRDERAGAGAVEKLQHLFLPIVGIIAGARNREQAGASLDRHAKIALLAGRLNIRLG
jgi:hypothetical protein